MCSLPLREPIYATGATPICACTHGCVPPQAGLYNKWMEDMLSLARQEGRLKQRQLLQQEGTAPPAAPGDGGSQALTLKHLQGPMFLIAGGWLLSFLVFASEGVARLSW